MKSVDVNRNSVGVLCAKWAIAEVTIAEVCAREIPGTKIVPAVACPAYRGAALCVQRLQWIDTYRQVCDAANEVVGIALDLAHLLYTVETLENLFPQHP